jgi:hypothetical protein
LGKREYRIANQGRGEFGSKSIRYVGLLPKQLTNCAGLGTLGGPEKEAFALGRRVAESPSIGPDLQYKQISFLLQEKRLCLCGCASGSGANSSKGGGSSSN